MFGHIEKLLRMLASIASIVKFATDMIETDGKPSANGEDAGNN